MDSLQIISRKYGNELAKLVEELVAKYPKWKTEERQEREIKVKITSFFVKQSKDEFNAEEIIRKEKDVIDILKGGQNG